MRTKIFISYRRQGTPAHAGRLYDGLCERFGEKFVFMDIDNLRPGTFFADVLKEAIKASTVFLVVIGKNWVGENGGRRRIDDDGDYVRMEVAIALGQGKLVIPVLVDGAALPARAELPENIRSLASVQAFRISDEHWRGGVARLASIIKQELSKRAPPRFNALASLFNWHRKLKFVWSRSATAKTASAATGPLSAEQPREFTLLKQKVKSGLGWILFAPWVRDLGIFLESEPAQLGMLYVTMCSATGFGMTYLIFSNLDYYPYVTWPAGVSAVVSLLLSLVNQKLFLERRLLDLILPYTLLWLLGASVFSGTAIYLYYDLDGISATLSHMTIWIFLGSTTSLLTLYSAVDYRIWPRGVQ